MARMNWQRARRRTTEPLRPDKDDREPLSLPRKVGVRRSHREPVETPEVRARIEETRRRLAGAPPGRVALTAAEVARIEQAEAQEEP